MNLQLNAWHPTVEHHQKVNELIDYISKNRAFFFSTYILHFITFYCTIIEIIEIIEMIIVQLLLFTKQTIYVANSGCKLFIFRRMNQQTF